MITVAYVFAQGDLGGAELATSRILAVHDRTVVEPVAFLFQEGAVAERVADAGVRLEVAPARPRLSRPLQLFDARRWLAGAIARQRVDVVHSVLAWTHIVAAPAGRRAGTKLVWFQHTPPERASALDWWAALQPADLVLVNSQYTAARQRRLNLRGAEIAVIEPPVGDVRPIYPRDVVRRTLDAAPDDVLAVLPARLQRSKGQDVALRALAQALGEAPSLRLAIVGETAFGFEPEFRGELEAEARELGVAARVRFTGFQRSMGDLYQAADIVLQPSLVPEGYGLVTAEALAAGRPVIASRTGGTAELVQHGRTGMLVPPGDVAALAAALVKLARDATYREFLAAQARGRDHVTPQRAARRLERLYQGLAG